MPQSASPFKLYADPRSGNCFKVWLLLGLLDLPFQWISVDILKQETGTAEFLSMNPQGMVPVLQLRSGENLYESNAILCYLAQGHFDLWPVEPLSQARVLQWLFFEQNNHEPNLAGAHFMTRYLGHAPDEPDIVNRIKRGYRALKVMEKRLAKHAFMAGETLTIADISLYPYTYTAPDASFDLSRFPGVRAWLKRLEAQPRWLTPAALAASHGSLLSWSKRVVHGV
ncbi:MAG: glutathione S-transferase family protein [Candidatus Contendobacter sp.]|nr:glutathione S-transferase family protein [Candidatus Contendobacter sp.]MDG4558633.1 glutathione S-transferase family protein [Candidatus Contendobacter sp.]